MAGKQINDGVTFVLLGATGDLTKKKLLPAIYHLVAKGKARHFAIIGASRKKTSMDSIINSAKKYVKNGKKEVWDNIAKRAVYTSLDFYKKEDYVQLKKVVKETELRWKLPGKMIVYLATLPAHFEVITKHLEAYHMCKHKKEWPRVVYEKPFGHDLKSAKKINKTIRKIFEEKHIYRIDHYLGKEFVENISLVRFTNRILEPLWNKDHIEQVQIYINEDIGIDGRGGYYDKYGVVRDMVQNHLLQLAALIAMEPPKDLSGDAIRDRKVDAFKRMRIHDLLLGQYQGYLKEKNVAKGSITPTFAALHLRISNKRWKGVPFLLMSGKKLPKREAGIHIKFKRVACLLPMCPEDTNSLSIRIQPNEGITFQINGKVPGKSFVT
ncbi:TPA: glucose-6-phosphate dehydrogenase, partial [Candidatus Woesearchaeota archaeon]|nr:glucose-6-phosphate dehydrogenase [Candidatus Woesearchaeota archaeon]